MLISYQINFHRVYSRVPFLQLLADLLELLLRFCLIELDVLQLIDLQSKCHNFMSPYIGVGVTQRKDFAMFVLFDVMYFS